MTVRFKAKKVYMFRYRTFGDVAWADSKVYVSAYQCQKAADEMTRRWSRHHTEIEFYESEISWNKVDKIYNKNNVKEQVEKNSSIVTFPEPKRLV